MSDDAFNLDLREQVARIDRAQAETRKLSEEAVKLQHEAFKLHSEALKLGRDRFLAPVLAAVGITGVVITVINLLLQYKR